MNTLKYVLEYHCYPIWNYDEDGELIDNDLPDDLRKDTELDSILLKVQKAFDESYVDSSQEFSSLGFRTKAELQEFCALLFSSVDLLRARYGTRYHIECRYTEEMLQNDPVTS